MHKYHSFSLPPVQSHRDHTVQLIKELSAEESLIEISKCDDPPKGREAFWREISNLSPASKRYNKAMLSLPKKRQQEMPVLDLRQFQRSNANINMAILNTTSYMVIDDRSNTKKWVNTDHLLQKDKTNRKAKYLFRSRNKSKPTELRQQTVIFSESFYCSKLNPQNLRP